MKYFIGAGALTLVGVVGFSAMAIADNKGGNHGGMHHRPDFATLDANGDGQVTKDEMQAAHETMRAKHFSQADANGDGAVTLDELKAHMSSRGAEKAERRMKHMDANGDGKVTMDEMKAGHGKKYGKKRDKMFSKMDSNGDGTISQEEYDAMKEHPKGGQKKKAE